MVKRLGWAGVGCWVVLAAACGTDGDSSSGAGGRSGAAGSGQVTTGSSSTGSGGPTGAAGSSSAGGSTGAGGSTDADGSAGSAGSSSGGAPGGDASADASVPIDTGPPTGPDGPNAHAFNLATGVLNVDYTAYLSKHDITYNRANTNPLYGLTVGNGRVGAMVWSANGLTAQVSGADVSEQGAFASGLVNLSTTPAMDASVTRFQQVLSLYDGTLTTSYDANRTVTFMGSPNSEVMGVHVEDSRPGVSAVTFDVSIWDVSTLTNAWDTPNLNTWKTVTTYADATGGGISRGQNEPNNFGYTLAATVEGAAFTAQAMGNTRVRFTITPAQSYTIWFTSATRLNAPNHDSVAQARTLLGNVKTAGYATTLTAFKNFWHGFWAKSFVQYASNTTPDADYLENFHYLSQYVIAAGGYGNYPFHFINGVFRATQDNTKWSNAWWHWNQRDVYLSFLASNHSDVFNVWNDIYARNLNTFKSLAMSRFNLTGLFVPETYGWDGNARGLTEYTDTIYSTGTEAANNMYMQYAYSGDANYLRNTAYPFMKEVAEFYVARLAYNAQTQVYSMAISNSHETYWKVPNAITDLAAVRSLFPVLIKVSTTLGLDADLRPKWQDVLDHLTPYPTDANNYLPHQPPISQTRNNENVVCELIWPYGVTGIGYPDYQRAVSSWNSRPFPYGNVWSPDAIQAARLGLGDQAYQGMKTMLGKYQNYPNGFTNNTNGVFEYWGVHLSAMNESLFHSYNDKLRVFPALPNDTGFVGRFTLAAKGGFLVSSEREAGEIKYVGIKSLVGNQATVVNPWGTEQVQVRREPGATIVLTSASGELVFPTVSNGVYIVERTAKPLSRYTYAHISGTANRAAKHLSNPMCTLGM
jgi:hypothetical protein